MTHVELLKKMLENYEIERENAESFGDEDFYDGCIYALDEAIQYLKGIKELKED